MLTFFFLLTIYCKKEKIFLNVFVWFWSQVTFMYLLNPFPWSSILFLSFPVCLLLSISNSFPCLTCLFTFQYFISGLVTFLFSPSFEFLLLSFFPFPWKFLLYPFLLPFLHLIFLIWADSTIFSFRFFLITNIRPYQIKSFYLLWIPKNSVFLSLSLSPSLLLLLFLFLSSSLYFLSPFFPSSVKLKDK